VDGDGVRVADLVIVAEAVKDGVGELDGVGGGSRKQAEKPKIPC